MKFQARQITASLLLLITLVAADLHVLQPRELADKFADTHGAIAAKLGNFGFIQMNTNHIGWVVIPTEKNKFGCDRFDLNDFSKSQQWAFERTPGKSVNFIIMVKRGECSFTKKIANSQRFHASVLIVADFKTEADEETVAKIEHSENEGTLTPHIATVEIDSKDAYKLLDAVKGKGQKVQLRVTMEVSNVLNKVEVDFWYASSLDLGINLSQELSALAYSFGNDHNKKPLFTPRIASYACEQCPEEIKQKNCISNGKYCSFEPRFMEAFNLDRKGSDFELTGRGVLLQGLHETCLHRLLIDKYENEGVVFWTFYNYLTKCFGKDDSGQYRRNHNVTDLASCYDWSTVTVNGKEEVGTVDKCFSDSFAVQGDYESDNTFLKADQEWAQKNNVQYHPSIAVNNITYRGGINGMDLAMSICEAYRVKPDECDLSWRIRTFQNGLDQKNAALPNETDDMLAAALVYMTDDEKSDLTIDGGNHAKWHQVVAMAIFLVFLNLCCILVVRRAMKREQTEQMNNQVSDAVTKYFALAASDT